MDIKPKKMAKIIDIKQKQGSMNVNFVGGIQHPT